MGGTQIDDQYFMNLATHFNPSLVYLCKEIEKTDQAFEELIKKSSEHVQEMSTEL